MSVNGISLVDCEHSEAVSALKSAGDTIEMTISREICQSMDDCSIKNENLTLKDEEKQNAKTALSLTGRNSSSSLNIGDRILTINGNNNTSNINHEPTVNMINNGGNTMKSTLSKGKIIDNTIEVCDFFSRILI